MFKVSRFLFCILASVFIFSLACEKNRKHASLKAQRESFSEKNQDHVTVRFSSSVKGHIPLEFRFEKPALRFPVGEEIYVWAKITNLSKTQRVDVKVTGTIEPKAAESQIKITDCFCEETLSLAPKEQVRVSLKVQVPETMELHEDIFYNQFTARVSPSDKAQGH